MKTTYSLHKNKLILLYLSCRNNLCLRTYHDKHFLKDHNNSISKDLHTAGAFITLIEFITSTLTYIKLI